MRGLEQQKVDKKILFVGETQNNGLTKRTQNLKRKLVCGSILLRRPSTMIMRILLIKTKDRR